MLHSPPISRPLRRDAERRRDALIDAAAACFRDKGYLVPLEEIAARAGVGRGTLYRNFKDRMALVLAVFDRMVDEKQLSGTGAPLEAVLAALIRKGALGSALFNRLAADMPLDDRNMAAFREIGERTVRKLEPFVAEARAAGLVGADTDAEKVVLATRMVSALLLPHMSDDEVAAEIERGLAVIMNGLRPR